MMKVLRMTDRVPVKIGDVKIKLSPINHQQKTEILSSLTTKQGEKVVNYSDASFKVIKYTLKDVEGISYYDGSDFKLEFEGDSLTDECVNELLNAEVGPNVSSAAFALLNGYVDEVIDPYTEEKIEGIEILPVESATAKK